ncbi:MAG: Lrp/AsnC family transcriptional regulator [Methanobacteriota archaeon]|nr:MAG: Lrp/AsnC family transcriptional regulator [Euryarchaeota archaeon]
MDAKDFRLLVVLDENARQSFQALGRKVSLSAPAVRERLHRLEERGILLGYWVSINPAVFGREDLLVSFGGEWSRDEAIRALGGPDVAWVAWKVDGGVTTEVWPHDVKKAVPALEQFLGHRATWLSVAAGLSPKTVRKHVTDLIRDEAIYVVPRLGFLADSGEIVYHLVVAGTVSLGELRRTIGDAELVHETYDPPMRYLFCRADSLGELTAKTHALEALPNVSSVQLSLNREFTVGTEFVHRLVRERIRRSGQARAGDKRPKRESRSGRAASLLTRPSSSDSQQPSPRRA